MFYNSLPNTTPQITANIVFPIVVITLSFITLPLLLIYYLIHEGILAFLYALHTLALLSYLCY